MIATLKIQRRTRSRHATACCGIRLHRVTLTPDPRPLTPGLSRRGVSLLEVLIAVFVLTFGLMSVAMVIPAGQKLMVDASKSDRGAACGRAALEYVKTRGWYDTTPMYQRWGTLGFVTTLHGGNLLYGQTYFFDPYFFSFDNNEDIDSVRHFPYSPTPARELAFAGTLATRRPWPDRARARRVTFPYVHPSNPAARIPLREGFAEKITTWADELVFALESDDRRPRQMASWLEIDTTTYLTDPTVNRSLSAAAPVMPSDGFDTTNAAVGPNVYRVRQHPENTGRFTWAAMITPIVPLVFDGTFVFGGTTYNRVDTNLIGQWTYGGLTLPTLNPQRITRCEVSIVVFYNRHLNCPSSSELGTVTDVESVRERSVYAQLVGGGIGGGDVRLFIEDGDAARPPGYLNVKKNDWIMLKGLNRAGFVGQHGAATPDEPNYPGTAPVRPTVCKWYRVVSADRVIPDVEFPNPANWDDPLTGREQYVTLAGPDWHVDTTWLSSDAYTDANGDTRYHSRFQPMTDIAEAALIDDVVGVYTTIVDVTAQ